MSKARLQGHVAAERAARVIYRGLTCLAAVALLWRGVEVAGAICLAAGAFYLARPGPSDDLDQKTGR
jgi:hypothetical protein